LAGSQTLSQELCHIFSNAFGADIEEHHSAQHCRMGGQLEIIAEQTDQNAHYFQEQPFQGHRQPDRHNQLQVGKHGVEGRQRVERGQIGTGKEGIKGDRVRLLWR
jgi:hypothetical protein